MMCFIAAAIGLYAAAAYVLATPEPLVIQGEVDAAQISVSAKIAARVAKIHVREGEQVEPGRLLVTLDSPELTARLDQAKAAMSAADAAKQKADTGARKEEITLAENIWMKAKAAEGLAQKTCKRMEALFRDGVIAEQKMDEAQARFEAARSACRAAKASYQMALNGARKEDKAAADAMTKKAAGVVAEVTAGLSETRLTAPLKSEVAGILPNAGELITPGYPLVTLVNLDDVWVTFHVREDLLPNIRMGSVITAVLPALGNRTVDLKISYINALGQYATWTATRASGDFDLKTFEIRGVPLETGIGLRPGMSAIVTMNRNADAGA